MKSYADLSDEELLRLVDTPRMNYNGTLELIRRYKNKKAALEATESLLLQKRNECEKLMEAYSNVSYLASSGR